MLNPERHGEEFRGGCLDSYNWHPDQRAEDYPIDLSPLSSRETSSGSEDDEDDEIEWEEEVQEVQEEQGEFDED